MFFTSSSAFTYCVNEFHGILTLSITNEGVLYHEQLSEFYPEYEPKTLLSNLQMSALSLTADLLLLSMHFLEKIIFPKKLNRMDVTKNCSQHQIKKRFTSSPYIGMLRMGKPYFEAVHEMDDDKAFLLGSAWHYPEHSIRRNSVSAHE